MQRISLPAVELRRAEDEFSTTARIFFNSAAKTPKQAKTWREYLQQIFSERVSVALADVSKFYDGTALQSIVEQARADVMRIVSQNPVTVIKEESKKPRHATASRPPPEHGIHVTLRSDVLSDKDAVSNEALRNVLVLIFVMRLEKLRKRSIEILYDEIQHLQDKINRYEQLLEQRTSELAMLGTFRPRERGVKTQRRKELEDAVSNLKLELGVERLTFQKKEAVRHRLNNFTPPLHQPMENPSEQLAALARYATSFEAFVRSNMRQGTLLRFDGSNLDFLLVHEVMLDALPEEARVEARSASVQRIHKRKRIAYISAAVAAACAIAGAGIAIIKLPETHERRVDSFFDATRGRPLDPVTELREELTKNPFKINFSVDPQNPNNVVFEIQTRTVPAFVAIVEFLLSSGDGFKYDSGSVPFSRLGGSRMKGTWPADYLLKLLKSGKRGIATVYGKNQFGQINPTPLMTLPADIVLSDDLIARWGFKREEWYAQ